MEDLQEENINGGIDSQVEPWWVGRDGVGVTFWEERMKNEVKQGNAGKTPGKRICLIFIGTCGLRPEARKVGWGLIRIRTWNVLNSPEKIFGQKTVVIWHFIKWIKEKNDASETLVGRLLPY